MMVRLIADTYEGPSLVVRHVFYGKTRSDAEGVLFAHIKTDAFLRGSLEQEVTPGHWIGSWNGIPLSTVITYEP